jgi:hypothetical protein
MDNSLISVNGNNAMIQHATNILYNDIGYNNTTFDISYIPVGNWMDIVSSLGIILLANCGQHAICDIHDSIKPNNKDNMNSVSTASCASVTFLNVLLSTIVYATVGHWQCSPEGIEYIFVNYPAKNIASQWCITIGTLLYLICIVCTIPLYNFYLRKLSYNLYCTIRGIDNSNSDDIPKLFFYLDDVLTPSGHDDYFLTKRTIYLK